MKTASILAISILRRLSCATSVLLLGALSSGCIASADGEPVEDEELVGEAVEALTSVGTASWGTTTDTTGVNIASGTYYTCVMRGVQGNLNVGTTASPGVMSGVRVGDKYPLTGNEWLVAHGGAYGNLVNDRVFENNPVNGHAVCFPVTLSRDDAYWNSQSKQYGPAAPVKITDLHPTDRRQCFLSAVTGASGTWYDSNSYVRVVKKTSTDATHPTTGWYIESNVPDGANGSHARMIGTCMDFPTGTQFVSSSATAGVGSSFTQTITSGTGVKGCGLTSIRGAFKENDWYDGVVLEPGATSTGQWTVTVTNNKSAGWTCAK